MSADGGRGGESVEVGDEAAPIPRELGRPVSDSSHCYEHTEVNGDTSRQQRSEAREGAKSGLATLFHCARSASAESSLLLSSSRSLLPTLSEEERDKDVDAATDGRDSPESPGSAHALPSTTGEGYCASNASDPVDEHASRRESDGDTAFHAMLRSLSADVSLLALSVDDLTPSKLLQVRDALQDSDSHLQQDEEDRQEPSWPSTAFSRLARVRATVAVDTLRLLLERFRPLDVRRAVDASVRVVFCEAAASSGVSSLAKAPSALTACNIARVVLLARQQLTSGGSGHRLAEAPSKPRLELAKSLLLHARGLHAAARSPTSRGPKASPSALSARTPGSSSPATTRRATSILAMEGNHLLLQEKLSRFEHRVQSAVAGSVPRVRRDGDESVEAAAKRRQRALEYAARQQKLNSSSRTL